jgi:hypothetical protein
MRQLTDAQWGALRTVHDYPGSMLLEYNERTARSLVRAGLLGELSVGGYEVTMRGLTFVRARLGTLATAPTTG